MNFSPLVPNYSSRCKRKYFLTGVLDNTYIDDFYELNMLSGIHDGLLRQSHASDWRFGDWFSGSVAFMAHCYVTTD